MEILQVKTENKNILSIGDKIKVSYHPIVNGEEDKENPIEEEVIISSFQPNDDGSAIAIHVVNSKGENDYFYEDNLI